MKQAHRYQMRFTNFLLGLLAISVLACYAQSGEDSAPGIRAPDQSEEFEILNELEVDSHQTELYTEMREKLDASRLKSEHKDLIAQAFSTSVSGMPIGSFGETQVIEQTRTDREEDTNHFAVLETGHVQDLENGSKSYFVDQNGTPFYIDEGMQFDFTRGRVSAQSKSEITFRFTMKIDIPTEDSSVDFLKDLQFLQNIQWATELTIDKNDQTMKSMSLYLVRPIRKMFLFTLKTLRVKYDFEFIEDCGCIWE